jgi:sensor domain CHASE-containing protein
MYSSTEKTASSSLKLITQLIFLVFLLLLVVSTINLALSLRRYEQLQNEVKTVRQSYDRVQINGKTRLLLRGLMNIANGYEPNTSEMTMDRFRMF